MQLRGAPDTARRCCRICGPQEISLYHAVHEVNFWHQYQRYDESSELGADYIFVDHPCFRRAGGLYHNQAGEYGDNLFRFALLSLAALEAPLSISLGGAPS